MSRHLVIERPSASWVCALASTVVCAMLCVARPAIARADDAAQPSAPSPSGPSTTPAPEDASAPAMPPVNGTSKPAAQATQPAEAPSSPPKADAVARDEPHALSQVKAGCPSDSTEERCRSFTPDAKLHLDPGLAVYAQYALALRADAGKTKWFHEFELTRAHAWLGASYGDAHARILLEAVRSASEGALLGVGGDSFVMRVREAYLGYRLFNYVDMRAGLLPTLTIPVVERSWSMRAVNPSAIERAGLASPADLGATIVGSLPRGFGWVGVGGYNGEGYSRRELNRGKNVEIAAEFHPIAIVPQAAPLTVFGSYMSGSSGTGSARANRINAGLAWQGDRVRGGVAFIYALGIGANGAQNALAVDCFVKVTPIEPLMLGADVTYWKRDTGKPTDQVVLITATVGVRIVKPFASYFAFDEQILGAATQAALPSQDAHRFRLIAALELW